MFGPLGFLLYPVLLTHPAQRTLGLRIENRVITAFTKPEVWRGKGFSWCFSYCFLFSLGNGGLFFLVLLFGCLFSFKGKGWLFFLFPYKKDRYVLFFWQKSVLVVVVVALVLAVALVLLVVVFAVCFFVSFLQVLSCSRESVGGSWLGFVFFLAFVWAFVGFWLRCLVADCLGLCRLWLRNYWSLHGRTLWR